MADEKIRLDKKLLERGYWVATHRITIEHWTVRVLYGVIFTVYLFFFIQFALYMFYLNQWQSLFADSIRPIVNWSAIADNAEPLPLDYTRPVIFLSGELQYDFVVEVYNPNTQWAVESMSYTFSYGTDARTESRTTFILPGERRYVTALGIGVSDPVAVVNDFTVTDIRWKKMVRMPPLSWNYLTVPTYVPRQVVIDNGVQRDIPPQVVWSVQNASTLNIRTVVWQIVFFSGSKLAGVAEYRRENFPFLEARDFAFAVSGFVGRVDRVEVFPLVDVFDPDYYYLPS